MLFWLRKKRDTCTVKEKNRAMIASNAAILREYGALKTETPKISHSKGIMNYQNQGELGPVWSLLVNSPPGAVAFHVGPALSPAAPLLMRLLLMVTESSRNGPKPWPIAFMWETGKKLPASGQPSLAVGAIWRVIQRIKALFVSFSLSHCNSDLN